MAASKVDDVFPALDILLLPIGPPLTVLPIDAAGHYNLKAGRYSLISTHHTPPCMELSEATCSVLRIMSSPRAIAILYELLRSREGLSLTEIARKTRLGIQETHYVLGRLTSLGLVSRVSGKNYMATMLGSAVMREIMEIAKLTEGAAHLSRHLPLMDNLSIAENDWEIVHGLNTVLAHMRRILSKAARVSIMAEEPVNILVLAGVDLKSVGGRLLYVGGRSEMPPKLIREAEELTNLEIGYVWVDDYPYEIVAGEEEGLIFQRDLMDRMDHENAILLRGAIGMYFINHAFERFWQGARRPPSILAKHRD